MTDRTDDVGLDRRLEVALVAIGDVAITPFDAAAIARRAIARESFVSRRLRPFAIPILPTSWRAAAIVVALLAGVILAAFAAGRLADRLTPTAPLAFVRDGEVYVSESDGSGQRRILAAGSASVATFEGVSISPDGRTVAAVHVGQDAAVMLVRADGHVLGIQRFAGPPTRPALAWSPDSNQLAVLVDRGRSPIGGLMLLDAEARVVRTISMPADFVAYEGTVEWSHAGRSLLLTGCACAYTRPALWVVSLDDGSLRQIEAGPVWAARWSPDDRRIAAVSESSTTGPVEVRVITVADGTTSDVPALRGAASLAWAPDGDRLAGVTMFRESQQTSATDRLALVVATVGSDRSLTLASGLAGESLDGNGGTVAITMQAGQWVYPAVVPAWVDGSAIAFVGAEVGPSDGQGSLQIVETVSQADAATLVERVDAFDLHRP